ncbi:MAG: DUF4380 domain-containing protein [Actinobacteria bacterium]|nr:DUF4380 domain-containing protein [Actinomycetota bacterium]
MIKFEEKYNYYGWPNCLRITNKVIEIIVTTDVGPRIISFGFIGDKNLFGEIKEEVGRMGGLEYSVYGGARLWHAPEENPRCYYPDNIPVKYIWDGKTLKLIQETEITTGIKKEICLTFFSNKNYIRVAHRIYNKNLWDIEFAPWAINIMNLGGIAIIPQEPYHTCEEKLNPVRPLVLWSYTDMSDPRWIWGEKYIQIKQDPKAVTRQKIGILNTAGWAAYYLDGYVFIKKYKYNPKAIYPDFNVNTEIYTDSELLELETLGPLEKVKPDNYVEHSENWYLFKIKLNRSEKSIDKYLLPLIDEINKNKV